MIIHFPILGLPVGRQAILSRIIRKTFVHTIMGYSKQLFAWRRYFAFGNLNIHRHPYSVAKAPPKVRRCRTHRRRWSFGSPVLRHGQKKKPSTPHPRLYDAACLSSCVYTKNLGQWISIYPRFCLKLYKFSKVSSPFCRLSIIQSKKDTVNMSLNIGPPTANMGSWNLKTWDPQGRHWHFGWRGIPIHTYIYLLYLLKCVKKSNLNHKINTCN